MENIRFPDHHRLKAIFRRPPVLETERLILRPVRKSDAGDLYCYACDAEVARYVLWRKHESIRDSREQIRCLLRQYRRGQPGSWAIEEKKSGKMIGTIGFMWVSPQNRSAECGYSLSRAYWNRGLMTEALTALIRFGFETIGLSRIEAQHDVQNPSSGRVMQKCGMTREGVLRGRVINKGVPADTAVYSILSSEYGLQKHAARAQSPEQPAAEPANIRRKAAKSAAGRRRTPLRKRKIKN